MHFNLFILVSLLFNYITFVIADVKITSPSSGDSFSGSDGSASVKIKWKDDADDDDALSLTNIKSYVLTLCSGSNSDIQSIQTLSKGETFSSKSYTAKIDQGDVPNGYYFIQIYAELDEAITIHYSDRFKLTGMKGSSASIKATYTGDSPDAQVSEDAAATSINSKSFSVTYTKQTGKTRYAPMQLQPGTTVTHTKWSRRFATSAYTPFSTLKKSPNVQSTITPGWSYTPKSASNTAKAADYPTSFYAASSRVSKATLSSASKRKRWLD